MTDRQARACVYCAALSLGISILSLLLLIMFKIGYDQEITMRDRQHDKDIAALARWSVAIYEKLDASGCVVSVLPKVPVKESEK